MKTVVTLALLLLAIPLASAQSVKVTMNPQTLLPNDVAECRLVVSFPQPTYVSGITLYHPSCLEVKPDSVSSVGLVQNYELLFTIKAERSGIFVVDAVIDTPNGSIRQPFVVRVLGEEPRIVLDRTVLTLNEVNYVGFSISTPLDISNVVVIPLFDANPKVIFVRDGRGYFRFEPKKPEPLKFKIEFYNGENYHEVVQTVNVEYVKSRGVLINATPEYSVSLLGDLVKIYVRITNLRQDDIYSVKVRLIGENYSKVAEIPVMKSGESKLLTFDWSSKSPGKKNLTVRVSYLDYFNVEHEEEAGISVCVLSEKAVQFSGVEVESRPNGITVSGDVCNNGRNRVYNVMVSANGKSYYIGTLDPSDFDSFEIVIPANVSKIKLSVTWSNGIGETFENSMVVEAPMTQIRAESGSPIPIVLSVVTLIFVLAIIVVVWRRR